MATYRSTADPTGLLIVDKGWGETSHDVVARVRTLLGTRSVGHAGTLDPFATGVLVVCVGGATRLSNYVMTGVKCYDATLALGVCSASDDAEGPLLGEPVAPLPVITMAALHEALAQQVGTINQRPPLYSALKQAGQPLYQAARRGETVTVPIRQVQVWRVVLVSWSPPLLRILIWCAEGTYIRAMARDLGDALGCGASLHALRRLAVGPHTVAHAVPSVQMPVWAADGRLSAALLPYDQALTGSPLLLASEPVLATLQNGQTVSAPPPTRPHGWLVAVGAPSPDGRVSAAVQARAMAYTEGRWGVSPRETWGDQP